MRADYLLYLRYHRASNGLAWRYGRKDEAAGDGRWRERKGKRERKTGWIGYSVRLAVIFMYWHRAGWLMDCCCHRLVLPRGPGLAESFFLRIDWNAFASITFVSCLSQKFSLPRTVSHFEHRIARNRVSNMLISASWKGRWEKKFLYHVRFTEQYFNLHDFPEARGYASYQKTISLVILE